MIKAGLTGIPWLTKTKTSKPSQPGLTSADLDIGEFFEGGIDLTASGITGCFSNIAVDAKVATQGEGYTIEWATFDNATETVTPIGEAQSATDLSNQAPAGAIDGEFVQVTLRGKHRDHSGWSLPCRVVFRKGPAEWKLVGVERM